MSRMIDADALMELYADSKDFSLAMCNVPIPIIRQNILDMPTIDAAPVVRCRECKRFDRDNVICKMWLHVVASNDFCSYGEKEGAYNDT